MSKANHPSFERDGGCSRCGLSSGTDCPPGFWLSHSQVTQWQAAAPEERKRLEAAWRSGDTKGPAK